ncbi:hypothetical protein J4217_00520 [Candidatus Pacearchaeota archaeon]|nr:hypothetical protein [Candidatus Pacearchaeota archaeon]
MAGYKGPRRGSSDGASGYSRSCGCGHRLGERPSTLEEVVTIWITAVAAAVVVAAAGCLAYRALLKDRQEGKEE